MDKVVRTIIQIDEDKCNGCGICVNACHENAIGIIDGKASLLRDDYCDGLGNCLPACPTGAITFVEREALPYDEAAVQANMKNQSEDAPHQSYTSGHVCPGSASRALNQDNKTADDTGVHIHSHTIVSRLSQWPVQIKLVPITAPYYDGANLLIAADCAAYAYGNFHNDFMKNRITLIGCPKLDGVDYTEKLTEIIRQNNIKSLTIVRMVVPCCGGLEIAAKNALQKSGKFLPWQVITIDLNGNVIE